MESPDLNRSANDDRLAALLASSAAPLPDDGFSARVLAALPAPAAAGRAWHRPACYLAGTAAGVGYVLARGATWADAASSFDRVVVALVKTAASLADPLVVAALAVAALSLAVAFRAELRERLRH